MKKLLITLLALTLTLTLAPVALAYKDDDDAAYPVEGGNIYINEATKTVTGADRSVTSAVIPNGITSIGELAFNSCESLTGVVIPNSVTSIGRQAFYNCTVLTSVVIPDSVTSIGDSAFSGCKFLSSVVISGNVTSIGDRAFYGCSELTSVIIPEGVTSIGDSTFAFCSNLTSVVIPNGVTKIEDSAFAFCYSLKNVFIPDSVTSIEHSAFVSCSSLTRLVIPSSVSSIETHAFEACSGLTDVVIQDGVTGIGVQAFFRCDSLTSVFIPASVTFIGVSSFENCDVLTDIYFAGTEAQWSMATRKSSIVIDPSVTTVHYNSAAPSAGFTDVDAVYTDAVKWAVDGEFADAESATAFGAENPCPRWEVVSILWKAMGSTEPIISSVPFTDVSPDAPYYKAVCWAYEKKIALGDTETTFGPENTVERGQAMTFIHRAAGNPASSAATPFTDVPAGEYYAAPVRWAYENAIANGTDPDKFSPASPVTRAQMVTFLYRWAVENK